MEGIIYTPKGMAREYSPYALNIYNGCDHNCKYCYVKTMPFRKQVLNSEIEPRKDILVKLEKQLKKNEINEQVLLCFTGDAYCKADVKHETTREILKILLKYNVPIAILSKGGKRILRDLDLFKKFDKIKVGSTLTLTKNTDSLIYEPGASLPKERMETLKALHDEGIKTWVSFEPVIDTKQTIEILDITKDYVDQYKVGKMNHQKSNIDWKTFGNEISKKLIEYGNEFYIKKDLYRYMTIKLPEKYIDQDYLVLREAITETKETAQILQPALF